MKIKADDTSFHHVYIVAHVVDGVFSSPVKIGITKSLKSRLAMIQTGSPHKVGIAFAFKFPMRIMASAIEGEFHEEAAEQRMVGEWFDMSPLRALWLLTDIVKDFAVMGSEEAGSTKFQNLIYRHSGLREAMLFVTERMNANEMPQQ